MLKSWWAAFLDLLYPPKCPVCRTPVQQHGAWCQPCLAQVIAWREINVAGRRLSALDSCWALCEYSAGAKRVLQQLKYRRASEYAVYCQWLLTRLDAGRLPRIDVVVPVPLHAARQAERGFNQAELIFRRWAGQRGWPWEEALTRTRATAPQWELAPGERRKNIKGAFCLTRPEVIRNQTVLLVDDILTTGMTLNECARVLKKGGAGKVFGLALASGAADQPSESTKAFTTSGSKAVPE